MTTRSPAAILSSVGRAARSATLSAILGAALITVSVAAATAQTGSAASNPQSSVHVSPPRDVPSNPTASLASGRAELTLPRSGSLPATVSLVVSHDSVYVRNITLVFRGSGHSAHEDRKDFHSTLQSGETIAGIPTSFEGGRLAAVVVSASPGSNAEIRIDLPAMSQAHAMGSATSRPASRSLPGLLVASAIIPPATDRIEIPLGKQIGPIRELILTVRGGTLQPRAINVHGYDGDPMSVDASGTTLGPITEPLVVRLAAPETVRNLVVTQRRAESAPPATIEVRAAVIPEWFGPYGRNRSENGGWSLLGTSTIVASPAAPANRGELRLRGPEGKIQRLRFAAQRTPIRLHEIELLLADGRRETVPVNLHLVPGTPSEPIKLPPDATGFVAVELKPVLQPRTQIDTAIETWIQY